MQIKQVFVLAQQLFLLNPTCSARLFFSSNLAPHRSTPLSPFVCGENYNEETRSSFLATIMAQALFVLAVCSEEIRPTCPPPFFLSR